MKFLVGLLSGFALVLVVLILIGGYFGVVPGVSSIFGSDKPKDLGVTYTQADYQSARAKSNIARVDLPATTPPSSSLQFSGEHPASFSYSSAEVTALIEEKVWLYFPMHNCQVRFNPDGTTEFSGILEIDKLQDYALARGLSQSDINSVLDRVNTFTVLQKNMPIYLKGTASVINGKASYTTEAFKLGNINLPLEQLHEYHADIIRYVEDELAHVPGLTVNSFTISGGKVHFDGTLPDSVARAKAN